MALRHFTPYVDDLTVLTVEVPNKYPQAHLTFFLENKQTNEHITTQVEVHYKTESHHIYRLKLAKALDLDSHYYLMDDYRNKEDLIYRHIVRTATFDQHFFAEQAELGAHYEVTQTIFRLWAPLSEQVLLQLDQQVYPLTRGKNGVWERAVSGDYDGKPYTFLHKVNGKWLEATDPYALSSLANAGTSIVINPAKLLAVHRPALAVPQQAAIVYEMSVRDFSSQATAGFAHPSQYLGLAESPILEGKTIGLQAIKDLGVTHIQLLPVFDFGSVDETAPQIHYNWGYDPVQYGLPEGSYASNPNAPYTRILELQQAIDAYHQAGIGVIMDVVYNHVYDSSRFVFEQLVPGYSFRVDDNHQLTDGSWCGNDLASERLMLRKYILDTLKRWLTLYGMDGFRFDLMGLLDKKTMQNISEQLTALYPDVLLYGEGWLMQTGLSEETLAHQDNAHELKTLGFFNDDYRDTLKNLLISGPSALSADQRSHIEELLTGSIGIHTPTGRFASAGQSVNYLECHDNATLYDALTAHLPQAESLHRASFGLQILLVSQGLTFIHSGQEFFRTKGGIDNSYNSPDTVNQLDWQLRHQHLEHVTFIQQLIAFRKEQPAFTQTEPDQLKQNRHFYWLTPTVLRYSLVQGDEILEFLLNFSQEPYLFTNDQGLTLRIQYPSIGDLGQPEQVLLEGYSLILMTQKNS